MIKQFTAAHERAAMAYYHKRIAKGFDSESSSGVRYVVGENMIQVELPHSLADFAEAAAGHSGFGSGAYPKGIRRVVDNPYAEISRIFSSYETMKAFILTSECNAGPYMEEVRRRHKRIADEQATKVAAAKQAINNRGEPGYTGDDNLPAKGNFVACYGIKQRDILVRVYGLSMFKNAFYNLTLGEMADHFGLPRPAAQAEADRQAELARRRRDREAARLAA